MKDITREEFAKFWDKDYNRHIGVQNHSISITFDKLCDFLKLEPEWKTFDTVDELVKWSEGKKVGGLHWPRKNYFNSIAFNSTYVFLINKHWNPSHYTVGEFNRRILRDNYGNLTKWKEYKEK